MYVALLKIFSILSIGITSQPHVQEVRPNTYMYVYMYTSSNKSIPMGMCALVKCMCMQILWNFRTTQRRRAGEKVRGEAYSVDCSLRAVKSVYLRGMAA